MYIYISAYMYKYVRTYIRKFQGIFCLSVYYGTNNDTGTVYMNELFLVDSQLRGNCWFLGRSSKTFPDFAGVIYRVWFRE
jgi:hypothetical protein